MSYVKDPIYGNHLGIVVNDASFDPEQRGRVQVWIPYLTNTLHSNWNEKLDDKKFKHIHESGALTPELVEELKNVLPWAECAGPIMGGGTSATYNPSTGITDTNPHRTFSSPTVAGTEKGAYIQGNIGPTSTGAHFDIKSVAGNPVKYPDKGSTSSGRPYFERNDLDNFVSVNGRPLSEGRTGENSKFFSNRPGRPSGHGGYDYAFGTAGNSSDDNQYALTLSGGAKWVDNSSTRSVGDKAVFELPDGSRYEILHGKFDPNYNNDQITQSASDTAEIAGETKNASAKMDSSDHTVSDAFNNQGFSQNILENIKNWEAGENRKDFNYEAINEGTAQNPVWTIGYGTPSYSGEKLSSLEEGEQRLINRLGDLNNTLNSYDQVKGLNQNQREALLSFSFNTGEGNLKQLLTSDGGRNNWNDISSAMSQYNKAKGETLAGLTNRRNDEISYGNGVVDPNSPLLNPIPNNNPPVIPAGLAGSQPSGFISTPKIGAKVFVFFLAGDIQKPIYFAGLLEKESYQKAQAVASPSKTGTGPDWNQESNYMGFSGGLLEGNQKTNLIEGVPINQRTASLYSHDGSGIDLSGANTTINATNDFQINAYGSAHFQSLESSRNIKGVDNTVADQVEIKVGFTEKQNNQIYEAQEKLKNILKEIQEEKIKDIESNATKGEKVPCPLCSTSHAVDRASKFAKKVFSFTRTKLPYFSYAVDVLEFLTTVLVIPFCSVVPGSALGECGNEECEDGMIPSPQKPIEDANKKAAEKLVSKQKEINELEKKLGSGGCYSVAALKDVVISAGGPMNDAKCYAKTTNQSIPISLQTKKGSKETMRHESAKNLKNVPYIPPVEYPGGNILLKGGNAVKIIAGAPGIELNTIGKISLNCGSIEVLSADGQLLLGSKNHTTLSGKVVTISANDKTKGGGVNIDAPKMICKGFSATGDVGIKGGARIDGELSIPYLNTVAQRMQCDDGMSPDQRIPFANWAMGAAQSNDLANTIRLALTHYSMPNALLILSNITKLAMQNYNTILTNTILEPSITGIYYGFCTNAAGPGVSWGYVQNFHHNHLEDPKPHHHDYIMPKGTYYNDIAGVNGSSVEPNEVPTRARKHGLGPEGGPKSLAGCGGFGGWGGSTGIKRAKLNSFGLDNDLNGFNGTVINKNNIKYKYERDGTVNITVNDCD
jgi:GH24 family phage-related lysozyme (muramidase)